MTGQAETAFVRQSVREPDARRPGGLATSARAVQDWDGLAHLAGGGRGGGARGGGGRPPTTCWWRSL
jgi:hypothetical protein